jgi:hypothetical protein
MATNKLQAAFFFFKKTKNLFDYFYFRQSIAREAPLMSMLIVNINE